MAADMPTARGNVVLGGLSDDELARLVSHLHEVPLERGDILYERGAPITALHFPTTGMVSVVHEFTRGEVVEIATVGREGMTGISVFLGAAAATERATVQIAGRALRLTTADFERLGHVRAALSPMLRRYTLAMFVQLGRNAACNRVHRVSQRAARWLLMSADRMQSPTFELTQEFLAQMLAVRRASVGEVAQALADEGCITYTRGSVTILDFDRLHTAACECYDQISQTTRQIMGGP